MQDQDTRFIIVLSIKILVAIAYIVLGGYVILSANIAQILSPQVRIAFAVATIVYGIFRLYRGITTFKEGEEL